MKAICVGVDWGSVEHDVVVIDEQNNRLGRRKVPHSGDGLQAFVRWLLDLAHGDVDLLHVAIETPRGSVVEALLERGIAVYAINPKQVDRFRDRHNVAGVKNDALDALVLADSLRTDRRLFSKVKSSPGTVMELRELTRLHEGLTTEYVRIGAQLREQLHRSYPQFLELGDLDTEWCLTLIKNIPTPADARKSKAKTLIQNTLREYRVKKFTAPDVIKLLRSKPVPVAPGVAQAARYIVETLLPRLMLTRSQLRDVGRKLESLLEEHQDEDLGQKREHRDVEIILSLPGAGTYTVATMLSEGYEPLMERDYQRLRVLAGLAPVTMQTGKQRQNHSHGGPRPQVKQRRACNKHLARAMFHLASGAAMKDPHAKMLYDAAVKRGHSRGHALRIVADRFMRVLISMLKSNQEYDAKKWGCA